VTLPRNTVRSFPPLAPPSCPCLTTRRPVLRSTSPTVRFQNSEARKPVSSKIMMISWSWLPVGRRIAKDRRNIVLASRQYRQALISSSTSSLVKASTGAILKRGAGISKIGFGMLSSLQAQRKNAWKVMWTLRIVLAESGWVLPLRRCGLYSVRGQAR
jgi:hypothetical protein